VPRFRKKPVEIEARVYSGTPENRDEIVAWMRDNGEPATWYERKSFGKFDCYVIEVPTLEGTHEITPGYYVIQGVEGEFYGCDPGIFEKTYEPVV